jgi:hypothetical protein
MIETKKTLMQVESLKAIFIWNFSWRFDGEMGK